MLLYFETGKHILKQNCACFACKCSLLLAYFRCFVSVYLHVSATLQGQISLRNSSRPTTKTTGWEVLVCMVLYSVRSWYISQEKQVHYEQVQLVRCLPPPNSTLTHTLLDPPAAITIAFQSLSPIKLNPFPENGH